jgi:hypothetical protein
MRVKPLVIAAALFAATARAEPPAAEPFHWVRANFHAHAASMRVGDDGTEKPADLHRVVRARGFDFSVHSAHSTENEGPDAAQRFAAQKAEEEQLAIAGLTIVLGEELTVAPGPNFQKRTQVLGHGAPGNLDHLSVFGMTQLISTGTPLLKACAEVHEGGGVCIVNHPGPGPMMWEEGLWESEKNRHAIDALEVYNGQAISAVGIDFEARYREATAYSGLGLHIAAVTGADTHGPKSVERARSRLAGLGGAAKLLKLMVPGAAVPRPELEAATLVRASSSAAGDVIAALKARRTVATYDVNKLGIELGGLGEIQHTGRVALHLQLSRKVGEVTLYREGEAVQSWSDVKDVTWTETVTRPTAYVFSGRDGGGRFTTSAVWFEPPK